MALHFGIVLGSPETWFPFFVRISISKRPQRPWTGCDSVQKAIYRMTDDPFFVCAECGDVGCGAITVRITRVGKMIRWSEFGFENNWEERVEFDTFKSVGRFEFDQSLYDAALLDALNALPDRDG